MQPSNIAYYVTAHGYGHGVRTSDIVKGLYRASPETKVHLITDLDPGFLRNRLPVENITIRPGAFDLGMVQLDSIRVDVPETLTRIRRLYEREAALIEGEQRFFEDAGIDTVVVDIPAIPLRAAHASGIRSLAVANFTWSWIYEEFAHEDPAWEDIIDRMEAAYATAGLLLRTPFAEPLEIFPRREQVPLLAEPGTPNRGGLHNITRAPLDRKWVLLSFTTLDWDAEAIAQVSALDDYAFFTIKPLSWDAPNIFPVDRNAFPVADMFATVDAVLTKPGFGALSECAANHTPMVYVEREKFKEYPILEDAVKRYLVHQHLPAANLYKGRIKDALDAVWTAPAPPEQLASGGMAVCAKHILGA
ncbi:MAG: hypothetical protein ACI9QL_001943 [Candidatus Omnitrophota bacterium]|jgi:hypothetical protein